MFKSWRNDKKKIKALFMLQFQATQVPKLKKPALVISLVPDDVGKPTFKLEKTAVQDGICLWENPIYLTVKLVREQKTGKLHEKIYHFIVSSGSSKSGYLGESSIDFADFAEETQPCTVTLPLKFANSGAVLHVTIQKVQVDPDGRYVEDYGDHTLLEDESLNNNNRYEEENYKIFSEDSNLDIQQSDGHDGTAKFQSLLEQNSITQKETINTRNDRKTRANWSMGSASDGSLVDSNSPEDGLSRDMQEASSEAIEKLKAEISSLMRQAELTELELQSLRKQVLKENKRAQDFSRQVVDLKEEKDALATKCEELKSSNKRIDGGEALKKLQAENKESRVQLEEIRRELSHEKELNSNLKLQLQKTQESNSEFIFAVKDLDEMMEQKKKEIACLSSELAAMKNFNEVREGNCKSNCDKYTGQQAVPAEEELCKENEDASEFYIMKKKITDLSNEIEGYREDREKLENYIEQLTGDYEELKQENQDLSSKLEKNELLQLQSEEETTALLAKIQEFEILVQRLKNTLKTQTLELSESSVCINELKSQVKGLEKELEKHAKTFENDLDAMTQAKIEQEQRAIRAEETLRKTKWKNAFTAERLQEELKRLSVEMADKLDENEKLMTVALRESNELRVQKRNLEERIQRAHEELMLVKDQYSIKEEELSAQLELKEKIVEQISLELEEVSKQLAEAQQHSEEKHRALLNEIQMLKSNIESSMKEKNDESEQEKEECRLSRESTQIEASLEETEMQRKDLEKKLAVAQKEGEKTKTENLTLKSSKDDNEKMIEKLLSDLESLRAQHNGLKDTLFKEELENENLRKQLLQSRSNTENREHGGTKSNRKVKNNIQEHYSDSPITACKLVQQGLSVAPLERDKYRLDELLHEMAVLKEKNKSMERELKEMQERYSEISLKFAEVEGERQQLVMTVRNLKGRKN